MALVNKKEIAFPCRVFHIHVWNTSGSNQYFQVFNGTSVPADGSTDILYQEEVLAGKGVTFSWGQDAGRVFTTGCSVCNSSTDHQKTIGSADSIITIYHTKAVNGDSGYRYPGVTG